MELFLQTLDQLFDYGRYSLEFFFMVFFFCFFIQKQKNFWLKFWILLSCLAVISITCSFFAALIILNIETDFYASFSAIFFALLGIPSIILTLIGYQEKIGTKLSVLLSAVAIRSGARSFYQLIYCSIGVAQNNPDFYQLGNQQKGYLVIYYVLLLIFGGLFTLFLQRAYRNPHFKGIDLRILFVFIFYFVLNIGISTVENYLRKNSPAYFLIILATSTLLSLLVVFIQFLFLFLSYKDSEKEIMEKTYQERMKEFRITKENVDLINLKCHDLRHQIRAAALSGKLDEAYVKEVSESIKIYDNSVHTGNEDLDLLLMDFKFRAQAASIDFPIIADGEAISFMERQDIISLFSNLIENSIEYEKNLKEGTEKYVSLQVIKKNGFLVVVCENSLGEQKKVSQPKDPRYHGFGTLSIRQIAKKYEGSYDLSTTDGNYKVSLTIPLPEIQK